jgi:hypothetical protein
MLRNLVKELKILYLKQNTLFGPLLCDAIYL